MGKTSIDVEVCSNCGPLQRLGSWLCNCRGGNHEAVPFVPASELAAAQGALRVACYKWKTIAPEDDNRTVDQLILWCIAAHARAEASPPATADGMERLLNAEVQFGLVAQGHIPEIEAMLAEGQDWNEIGAVICWHAGTAKQHYERYLAARAEAKPADGGGE